MTNTVPESGATMGYEADLWRMADALRGAMDAAEYKHVVLGLVFLKYISDSAGFTSTSSRSSRAPRGKGGRSSTRHVAWSRCSSR